MSVCYIVGAGDFSGEIKPCEEDLVIAADGGYKALISHGVRCDLLIGDLDSLSSAPSGLEFIRFPKEKDDTDSFLAYKEGVRRGFSEFRLYGCGGGREDHSFANYSLLLHAAENGRHALLCGKGQICFVLTGGEAILSGNTGDYFSVFAFGGEAKGVCINGAKYEAKDVTLTPDFPLGVSNSFKGENAFVSVKEGALLVIAYTDTPPRFT